VEVSVSKLRFTQRAARVAAVSGIAFVAIAPTAALAADYPNGGGTSTPTDPTQVEAAKTTKPSTLPFTGGDVAGMAAIGAGAVLAGAVIVRQSRRRALA
jgi:hypothetical protein